MKRVLRVAWHEFQRHVFTKRFVMGLLSVPLVILALIGLVFLIISMENDTPALGYVDQSGLLADPLPAPLPEAPDKPVEMLAYGSVSEAQSALEAGTIAAYYILPADYLTTGRLQVVHLGEVKAPARVQFYDFLSVNLLRTSDPATAARLMMGSDVTIVSPDGTRNLSSKNWFNALIPMVAGLGLLIAMFTSGGYLMQAVVEEKQNRTIEVVLTSVSPNQFMAGKIIGGMAIGLTQLGLWVAFIVGAVLLGRGSLDFLRDVRITSQTLLLMGLVVAPSFVMISALMAAVGATVTDEREGQQATGLLGMPIWIPYMLNFVLISNPNSPLAIGLSILPMTAPMTMLIRDGLTALPGWQIALSAVIQWASALGAIWLAGRAFRLGMLRYGKRLRWREVFRRETKGVVA